MCLFQTRACCQALENDAKRENKGMMSGDIRRLDLARQGPEKRYRQQETKIGEQVQAFMDRLSSSPGNQRALLAESWKWRRNAPMEETCKNKLEYWVSSQLVKLPGLKKSFAAFGLSI